jgi:hypothetical protein
MYWLLVSESTLISVSGKTDGLKQFLLQIRRGLTWPIIPVVDYYLPYTLSYLSSTVKLSKSVVRFAPILNLSYHLVTSVTGLLGLHCTPPGCEGGVHDQPRHLSPIRPISSTRCRNFAHSSPTFSYRPFRPFHRSSVVSHVFLDGQTQGLLECLLNYLSKSNEAKNS